jgi:predicted permease
MQAPRFPGWADIVGSVLLVLAVSVPTMILEEDWHGRPMIDQPTHLWILAAGLVAGAFFAGGAVVAFRRPSAPTWYAAATGVIAVGILLIGAICRRLWVAHEFIPRGVQMLWLAGVIGALTMTLAGSLLGRQLTR